MNHYTRYHFNTTDSTMTRAQDILNQEQNQQAILITAEHQEQGKGQYGKSWSSPAKSGIYMTLSFANSLYQQIINNKSSNLSAIKNFINNPEKISSNEPHSQTWSRILNHYIYQFIFQKINKKTQNYINKNYKTNSFHSYWFKYSRLKPINDLYFLNAKLSGILITKTPNHHLIGIGINTHKAKHHLKESLIAQPKAPPISIEEVIHSQELAEKFRVNFPKFFMDELLSF